jgi:large subunit ribosomal protein L9
MEVILREDYLPLGYVGDTVNVKRGFARNFLIPRGVAIESSSQNEKALKHKLSAIVAKRIKKKAEAEAFGTTLSQIIVEFTLKIGAGGKSFGAITARDVEGALKNLGYAVDRRQIRLLEVIKTAGAHKAEVKLHSEVTVPLQIKVMAAQIVAPPAEGAAAKGKGKKGAKKKSDESAESVDAAAETSDEAAESSEAAE